MIIVISEYNIKTNNHIGIVLNEDGTKGIAKVDFFVGCAIDVPVNPYNKEKYDAIAYGLIGKKFEIDERCYAPRHSMFLPLKIDIKEII